MPEYFKRPLAIALCAAATTMLGGCYYGDVQGSGYASGSDCAARYGHAYYDYDGYAYDDGYGYDCYDASDYGGGFVNIGFGGGWYDDYYYPGYGTWMFDTYRHRYPLRGQYLNYWGGRRAWWKHHGGRSDGQPGGWNRGDRGPHGTRPGHGPGVGNDGTLRAVDTIIYGTGFEATGFLAPMTITGRGGQTLNQRWQDGAEAYMGMTVSGFPNLFILYGPNTNLGAGSIIYMLEAQAKYVTQAVQTLQQKSLRWLDVKAGVISAYNLMLRRRSKEDSVYETGCHSWYITADGKNTVSWVGYMNEYAKQVARLKLDDFETAPVVTAVEQVAKAA